MKRSQFIGGGSLGSFVAGSGDSNQFREFRFLDAGGGVGRDYQTLEEFDRLGSEFVVDRPPVPAIDEGIVRETFGSTNQSGDVVGLRVDPVVMEVVGIEVRPPVLF